MKLEAGQWVRHSGKDTWGPGRVEAVSEFITVRFPLYRNGDALRFRPTAHPLVLDADQLHVEAASRLESIVNTPSRHPTAKNKAGKPAKAIPSVDGLIERFLTLFPDAFRGAKYASEERSYKREASRTCRESLDVTALKALIDAGDRPALVARYRQSIRRIVNLLGHPVPAAQFASALSREDTSLDIATGFVLMVSEPYADVGPFYRALRAAVTPRLTWQFATLLPALWAPDNHMFVQPEAFRSAMVSLGREETLRAAPDPESYRLVRSIAEAWLLRLAPLGAEDFLDVQSFINRSKPPEVQKSHVPGATFDED